MNSMHFYTTGSVPLEIWGQPGVCIVTVWNTAPNAPTLIWGITHELWGSLIDKGTEVVPSMFAGLDARYTLTIMNPTDWNVQ